MPSNRIKGQDVEIAVILDGEQVAALTDVRSFEAALQFEILREGYLGETTDRRDEVYRGARMRMELHVETQDVFVFTQALLDRAQRRDPAITINIKATLNFPNGETPRLIFNDVYFGEVPFSLSSRSDYATMSLEGECATAKTIQQ